MDEVLTFDEIKVRSARDSVLIGEPQTDGFQRLLRDKVLFLGPDREAVYRTANNLRPGSFAVRYLGEITGDMSLIPSAQNWK
jgi:hypothetical protein